MSTPFPYPINRHITAYLTSFAGRVLSAFKKTDTVLAVVPGLNVGLLAGRSYRLRGEIHIDASALGGFKIALVGANGLTVSNVVYQITAIRNDTLALALTSRLIALGGPGLVASGALPYFVTITGEIDVDNSGALSVQFAQRTANGTSAVLAGSLFNVSDIGEFVS